VSARSSLFACCCVWSLFATLNINAKSHIAALASRLETHSNLELQWPTETGRKKTWSDQELGSIVSGWNEEMEEI
jgi:hypothetical protein